MVTIWCTTSFIGFHRWKDAPEEVAYLRDFHRHKFNVEVHKEVTELNREIEFHTLKAKVDEILLAKYHRRYFEFSCEQLATELLSRFNACKVSVDEDGECGATVTR